MSLRTFHLIFLLAAIVILDMFVAWCFFYKHAAMGTVTIVAQFALIAYVLWFDHKLPVKEEEADESPSNRRHPEATDVSLT